MTIQSESQIRLDLLDELERIRQHNAEEAKKEMVKTRDLMDQARKQFKGTLRGTSTGALLFALGLGRPKTQGGRATPIRMEFDPEDYDLPPKPAKAKKGSATAIKPHRKAKKRGRG